MLGHVAIEENVSVRSFYRRPLPPRVVAFSSNLGRKAFQEALLGGTMENYFGLSEQFHTQADPAFCGLGSLVVALNALGVDPGRLWKGPWRWFDETLLDCCIPLETVRERGVTMRELACLAECNGARADTTHAATSTEDDLRQMIASNARAAHGSVIIAGYDRATLGQTGTGHFSPIAGYHEGHDWALVLDVARFKYPPHWVPIPELFRAMLPEDPRSKRSRGWILLTPGRTPRPVLFSMGAPRSGWRAVLEELREAAHAVEAPPSARAWVLALASSQHVLADVVAPIVEGQGADIALEHRVHIDALIADAENALASRGGTADKTVSTVELAAHVAEVIVVLALVLSGDTSRAQGSTLAAEVSALRRQLEAVCG